MTRKGILLAGGHGTRLYPITSCFSKQLLPVYDKPMVYYSLSILMLSGIRDILIIARPEEIPLFEKLLGNGSLFGIRLTYAEQDAPNGIAQAFLIGEKFIGSSAITLVLGDNILYGHGIANVLQSVSKQKEGATLFGYYVKNPEQYGVIYFDTEDNPIDLVEKPSNPTSNFASVGIYFYDNQVVEMAKSLTPSSRGELEITDINRIYLQRRQLKVIKLNRGVAWLDMGTANAWLEASNFVQILERRQGLKIACLEEIAWRMGYITANQLLNLANRLVKSDYGKYLINLAASIKSNNEVILNEL